jgi:hypothetical protein
LAVVLAFGALGQVPVVGVGVGVRVAEVDVAGGADHDDGAGWVVGAGGDLVGPAHFVAGPGSGVDRAMCRLNLSKSWQLPGGMSYFHIRPPA